LLKEDTNFPTVGNHSIRLSLREGERDFNRGREGKEAGLSPQHKQADFRKVPEREGKKEFPDQRAFAFIPEKRKEKKVIKRKKKKGREALDPYENSILSIV